MKKVVALLRAADAPIVQPILITGYEPEGPYGAKGLGEFPIVPVAAAVANAAAHAIGVYSFVGSKRVGLDPFFRKNSCRENRHTVKHIYLNLL